MIFPWAFELRSLLMIFVFVFKLMAYPSKFYSSLKSFYFGPDCADYVVGRGYALVESMPFDQRVVVSITALAAT